MTALLLPLAASAHVKWFAHYDVHEQPRPLSEVWSGAFWELVALSLITLWMLCRVERTAAGAALMRAIDRGDAALRLRTEDLFRGATAVFFVAIGTLGNTILTPELKLDWPGLAWIDFAIAVGMFWRSTLVFSALGIAALYAIGIANYGLFHMMDYPIFLGVAAYLGLTGLQRTLFGLRPLDVARWTAAVTLIWASVEKWAYPDWTFPLLVQHQGLSFGLDAPFYMVTAGVVEFGLAFALLWTPLLRRLGAVVLMTMFISAIFEFGKIDAIGHLLIITILLAIAVDDQPKTERTPILAPALYCAALAAVFLAYYGTHVLFFGLKGA